MSLKASEQSVRRRKKRSRPVKSLNDVIPITSATSVSNTHTTGGETEEEEEERGREALRQQIQEGNDVVRKFLCPESRETVEKPKRRRKKMPDTKTDNASDDDNDDASDDENDNQWVVKMPTKTTRESLPQDKGTPVIEKADKDEPQEEIRDGRPVLRPTYHTDRWAVASVRDKIPFGRPRGGKVHVPPFIIRRNQPPPPVKYGAMTVQIFTFHADGSSDWPTCSEFRCWNCHHHFDGPPAMIPRYFHTAIQAYEMYGNFCSWNCTKSFANRPHDYYPTHERPLIDTFAKKYFRAKIPITPAPSTFLLQEYSHIGMTIEKYRRGFETIRITNFAPPMIPYEIIVAREHTRPTNNARRGKRQKRIFERQMAGDIELPDMPAPISLAPEKGAGTGNTRKRKAPIGRHKRIGAKPSPPVKRKRQRNLLTLMAGTGSGT